MTSSTNHPRNIIYFRDTLFQKVEPNYIRRVNTGEEMCATYMAPLLVHEEFPPPDRAVSERAAQSSYGGGLCETVQPRHVRVPFVLGRWQTLLGIPQNARARACTHGAIFRVFPGAKLFFVCKLYFHSLDCSARALCDCV